jgi:hypothetical protein
MIVSATWGVRLIIVNVLKALFFRKWYKNLYLHINILTPTSQLVLLTGQVGDKSPFNGHINLFDDNPVDIAARSVRRNRVKNLPGNLNYHNK